MPTAVRIGSLGDRLAENLRLQIIRRELPPGTHLVEDTLAQQFDVSRGPVRDALAELSREGLIDRKRRGFFVRGFDVDDIHELYDLRGALESLAITGAMARAREDEWDGQRRILDRMTRSAEAGDWQDYATSDLAFHTEFYALARNTRLATAWSQYQPTFGTILNLTNQSDVNLLPSVDDHFVLHAAAKKGERAGALSLLTAHLDGSKSRILSALKVTLAT